MAEKDKVWFVDWFNINNPTHLKALENYLANKGWPKHFIPADIIFGIGRTSPYEDCGDDILYVCQKITKAWIKMKTSTNTRISVKEN